jgi:regulatory protein
VFPTNDQKIGIITKIEQQKRAYQRYNVYINEEYSFSVHEDVLVSCRLIKGKEIQKEDVENIVKEEERKKIERAGIHYLSFRPRTVTETRRHLKTKEFDSDLIENAIETWIKQGYLDDHKFAEQWVQERVQFKFKGSRILQEELRQKGVSSPIIQIVLENIDDGHEKNGCLQLARKKIKSLGDLEDYRNKAKLFQYLQRRGFQLDTILSIYQKLKEEMKMEES